MGNSQLELIHFIDWLSPAAIGCHSADLTETKSQYQVGWLLVSAPGPGPGPGPEPEPEPIYKSKEKKIVTAQGE